MAFESNQMHLNQMQVQMQMSTIQMQVQMQMRPPRGIQMQVQMQMPHLHLQVQMHLHLNTSLVSTYAEETLTDSKEIADKFNTFFTNIGSNLAKNIIYNGNKTNANYLIDKTNNVFTFTPVDDETVTKT